MARKKTYKTLTGMDDIFGKDLDFFKKIENISRAIANFYNFKEIITPILEEEELFKKGTGENTDIIQKETYSFSTKGKEKVILRPEFTPSLVRAYIQNGMEILPKPVRLWTFGPLFRHEKPQKGRKRQFFQFNFEVLGTKNAIMDALLIQLFSNILYELGVEKWKVNVNSIGCQKCRPAYLRKLKSYYTTKAKSLCPDCKKRLISNPLRVLDCKEEKCQRIKKFSPQILNYLCEECHNHFKVFLEFIDELEIPYVINPYLVRGLDYYEKTVFEFIPEGKELSSQNALIGGGRYNKLVEMLGGRPTFAVGGAGGVERIIEEIKEKKINKKSDIIEKKIDFNETPKVFLVQLGELAKKRSLKIIEELKKSRIKIEENLEKDNLKSQLSLASQKKVKYTLILGQQECVNNEIIIRNMENGIQEIVPQQDLIREIKKRLK
jgi:histidyl-tRNA synthetase